MEKIPAVADADSRACPTRYPPPKNSPPAPALFALACPPRPPLSALQKPPHAYLAQHGVTEAQLKKIYHADELITGDSAIFCATGISDSALLPGVRVEGHRAITHSILMRAKSRSVRRIETVHDLRHKTIRLRGDSRERTV